MSKNLHLCSQDRIRTCMRNFLGPSPMARCPLVILASTFRHLTICCPTRVRTSSLLIQKQTCCQLHYGTFLGKQKMGAWTSAFTIGVTNLRFPVLPVIPFPNQPNILFNLFYNPISKFFMT